MLNKPNPGEKCLAKDCLLQKAPLTLSKAKPNVQPMGQMGLRSDGG
jgi:hypothetical protein